MTQPTGNAALAKITPPTTVKPTPVNKHQIYTKEDFTEQQYFNCFLTGMPGSSKTGMALTAPGPIHFLDIDGKLETHPLLQNRDDVTFQQFSRKAGSKKLVMLKSPKKDIQTYTPRTDDLYIRVLDALNAMINTNELPFKTLVVDTFSRLIYHLEQATMIENQHDMLSIPDRNLVLQNVKLFITTLLDLPCNVIVCSHIKEQTSPVTKQVTVYPELAGQLANVVPGYFHEAYYLQTMRKGGATVYQAITKQNSAIPYVRSALCSVSPVPADFKRIITGEFRGEAGERYIQQQKVTLNKEKVEQQPTTGGVGLA